ncbi:MAG TPA: glycosyltransferase [Methanolinea sp.]|nr:glycosyltransferase [Methanolinea sp.]
MKNIIFCKGLVSIIIPTYNRASFLIRAIESIFDQTYKNYEIIIIDDGSTDSTKDIMSKYLNNVNYIRILHSGIPAIARNIGIKHSKGEYIAFLDSDDYWCKDKLKKQLKLFNKNKNLGLVCSNAYKINENSKNIYFPKKRDNIKKSIFDLIEDNFVITSSCIIRKNILQSSGLFCEQNYLKGIEDYDLWLRIGLISEINYIEEPLCYYTIHNKQLSKDNEYSKYLESLIFMFSQILNENFNQTIYNTQVIEQEINYKIIQLKLELLMLFLRKKNIIKIKSIIKDLIKTNFKYLSLFGFNFIYRKCAYKDLK